MGNDFNYLRVYKYAVLDRNLTVRDLPRMQVLNGTPGYINLLDAINAWQLVHELGQATGLPAAASFKHVSPAGAAIGLPLSDEERLVYEVKDKELTDVAAAYVRARFVVQDYTLSWDLCKAWLWLRNADPMCSFGDFVAISHEVDVATAMILKIEVSDGIIAPSFAPEALETLKAKKGGKFIVLKADAGFKYSDLEYRMVGGVGFMQKRNDAIFDASKLAEVVTASKTIPDKAQKDLILASIAIKRYTQSNSVGYSKNGMMVGVGAGLQGVCPPVFRRRMSFSVKVVAQMIVRSISLSQSEGQQSRVDCVKLAGRKVATWWLRFHPKVKGLPFKDGVKRQDRVNARVRYIEGDMEEAERTEWLKNFDAPPEPLSAEEKSTFLKGLDDVAISSDAFFPFRDSIDHATRLGVKFVAQPGGSVADKEVIDACNTYGMTMAFTQSAAELQTATVDAKFLIISFAADNVPLQWQLKELLEILGQGLEGQANLMLGRPGSADRHLHLCGRGLPLQLTQAGQSGMRCVGVAGHGSTVSSAKEPAATVEQGPESFQAPSEIEEDSFGKERAESSKTADNEESDVTFTTVADAPSEHTLGNAVMVLDVPKPRPLLKTLDPDATDADWRNYLSNLKPLGLSMAVSRQAIMSEIFESSQETSFVLCIVVRAPWGHARLQLQHVAVDWLSGRMTWWAALPMQPGEQSVKFCMEFCRPEKLQESRSTYQKVRELDGPGALAEFLFGQEQRIADASPNASLESRSLAAERLRAISATDLATAKYQLELSQAALQRLQPGPER
ncbi:Bifunctional purine biosynthesis protein PURH [Symbiodinium microadriaticum]|uniref:Bifunctional purine biosynthesis protein PURH n=1 Tax=Symbiodinium microadriaticum TaxID=2951 RepID=A0A1Q9F498_SYMMI|nr:Bifunctional purine biosynthesis protein PURH [Symbiodinium microadriaticum]